MLTKEQVQELLDIVSFQHIMFVGYNVGTEQLSNSDRIVLKKHGITPELINTGFTPVDEAFYFGRLSMALGHKNAKDLTYNQFKQFMRRGQYEPLTNRERATLQFIKNNTYNYVKGLENAVIKDVSNIIETEQSKRRTIYESVIRDAVKGAVVRRDTVSSIVSEIGNRTGDWQRNLGRIAETEMQNALEHGRAEEIIKQHGKDAKVFKQVFPGACFPIEDTEFLTSEGFKYLDNIRGDEKILSFNKDTNLVEWVKITSKIRYEYSGKMHHYKNNGLDLLSTPNHKHLVKVATIKNKKYEYENILTESYNLRNIKKRNWFYQSIENWEGISDLEINICGRIFETKFFAAFMGWWLSEGHIGIKNKYNTDTLFITQHKKHNLDELEYIFKNTFPDKNVFKTVSGVGCSLWKNEEKELIQWFKNFGKSYEKYIPKDILNLNKEYLKIFLDSYIKGDGHIENSYLDKDGYFIKGKTTIRTSSKKIVDGLSEVILKLNLGVSFRERWDMLNRVSTKKDNSKIISKRLCYDVNVLQNTNTRNINLYFNEIENFKGIVGCLELEKNNTLLIRRSGHVVWTGNCKYCIQLYLTNGLGSEPRLFTIPELEANGNNYGVKAVDYKPTITPTHPYCRCSITYLKEELVWNKERKMYSYPRANLDRKYGIKITVGDKVYDL